MNQGKKIYLEAIRIVAIFLVIFNHTDGFIYFTLPCSIITQVYSLFLAIVCRIAVPLFFMVSGALLLTREQSPLELVKRRIARILIVLMAVSLLYYLFDIARGRVDEYGIRDFMFRLSTNGIRESFWFLYTYTSTMLLLPFFRKAVLQFDKELILYLIGLRGLTDFVLPVIGITTGLDWPINFGTVIEYYYYILMGYYLDKEEEKIFLSGKKDGGVKALTVSLLALVFINGVYIFIVKGVTGEYKIELLDFLVFLTAPLVFLIVKRFMDRMLKKGWECKCLYTVGESVFGIYLLDNFTRWQFLPVYLFLSEKMVGILANSVYILLVFSAGFVYTRGMKKIPVVRRYI